MRLLWSTCLFLFFIGFHSVNVCGADTPKLIDFKVIERTDFQDIKVSYDIQVDAVDKRLPTKEELAAISNHLRQKERRFKRMFVSYYLPGMVINSGAFATAHHNPHPEKVRFLSMTIPKRYQHLVDFNAARRGPTQCDTLSQLAKLCPNNLENFKIINETGIPHFQITCSVFKGDSPDVINEEMISSLVTAIILTFVHTKYDSVKVTVIPEELDVKTKHFTFLKTKAKSLTATRNVTLKVFQKHTGIESLNDLFGGLFGDTYFPDQFSPRFLNFFLNNSKVQHLYTELPSAPPKQLTQYRIWTDATGKHKIKAVFTGTAFGKVKLRRKNGKTVTVPLDKLSEDDQRWVATQKR